MQRGQHNRICLFMDMDILCNIIFVLDEITIIVGDFTNMHAHNMNKSQFGKEWGGLGGCLTS